MMDYRYDYNIKTDVDNSIIEPTIVLCTRSCKKIGVINNIENLRYNHPLVDVAEISFDVYKVIDGVENIYWDYIKDFKFIYLPDIGDSRYQWYEITITIDEDNNVIKHVTGVHAEEAELGQLMLYDVEINTENDIARDDYEIITIDGKEYGTVFYNEQHPKSSLLHRMLSDKAPLYEIKHVDDTLKNIQREFSFNGVSIVDALKQTVAQEIGCLFVFGEDSKNNGKLPRTISAYDLMDYCEDCGERGNYTQGICLKCGSKKIRAGYGKDTGIFINAENLTDSISFSSSTDQVKNFFRLGAGDEYMEAAIRNCNPNGSNYLCYFSDEMKEDMSEELTTRLNEYEIVYDAYFKEQNIYLPVSDVNAYNALVNKYQNYIKEDLIRFESTVHGFEQLTDYGYNSVNFRDALQTTMMPASPDVKETTAQKQLDKLTLKTFSKIGVENADALSLTAANTAVETYAKVYINSSRYKINTDNSTYKNKIWRGMIIVTSLTDKEDTANKNLIVNFNNDGATFLKQKIQKMMEEHKVEDIGDVSFLQKEYTTTEYSSIFKPALKKYSLDSLKLLDDLCSAAMDILAEAGQGTVDSLYYKDYYYPYWKKRALIMEEEKVREKEIESVNNIIDDIEEQRTSIINYLDLHNFFGDDLYSELMLYRRETEYVNSNFISDGLTDSEVIDNAKDYFKRAQEEIIKASTIQHSITCSLYNLFLIPEFRSIYINEKEVLNTIDNHGNINGAFIITENGEVYPNWDSSYQPTTVLKMLIKYFDSGNWLRIRVDDKIYKLRLTNWEINYESLEQIEVEFSDVIYTGNTMSDVASVLSQARTMATSYNAVMRQAEKGNKANNIIENTQKQGLILSQSKIINDANYQNFILNSQGALMRAKNEFDDSYNPEQIKLLNKGIYYTNDSWETVQAGLGRFTYIDPDTGQEVEDYGVIASTIVGKLILGNNLKIFSENGSLKMNENGFVIDTTGAYEGNDIFTIQKTTPEDGTVKYLYVDGNGNVVIRGTTVSIEDLQGNTLGLIDFVDKTVDDALPIEIRVESSRGIVFKNKGVNTILTATVFKGNNDITDKVKKFIWTKYDGEGNLDTSWSRELSGNSIVISSADVTRSARFCCSVEL